MPKKAWRYLIIQSTNDAVPVGAVIIEKRYMGQFGEWTVWNSKDNTFTGFSGPLIDRGLIQEESEGRGIYTLRDGSPAPEVANLTEVREA